MSAHPCPVCGLRFASRAELTDHAAADHTKDLPEQEEQETIQVQRREEGDAGGVVHLPW